MAAACGILPRRFSASRHTINALLCSHELMRLDQFLKWQGWVGTGGEAKMLIQAGEVRVNDCVVTQRGRQLKIGDRVILGGDQAVVSKI